MINKKIDLALAFLESQPAVAAEVLERQPVETVAVFFNQIPHTYIAPVLVKMLPQYAARLCLLLDVELSVGFLSKIEVSMAAAILRHSKPEVRKKILSLLPDKTKIACKLLLSYSEDSVGAWMVAHIATLPNDCTVGDALKRLAEQEASMDADAIYVVNRERQLQGWVKAVMLLRANPEASIASVMQQKPGMLQARASLFSVNNHDGWLLHDTLPVVNRNNQLVGMLRYVDLRKGLEHIDTAIEAVNGDEHVSNIFKLYGESLLVLFNVMGEMVGIKKSR